MATLISERIRTARKQHDCMACEWLTNAVDDLDGFTFAEKRAIVLAKRDNWKIKPGDKYLSQTVVYDGSIGDFKAIPAIDAICHKHNIYEYD